MHAIFTARRYMRKRGTRHVSVHRCKKRFYVYYFLNKKRVLTFFYFCNVFL